MPLRGIDSDAQLERLIDSSIRNDWVVYAKPPFGGPEQVLKYLSRYTHRIAISNARLAAMDGDTVTFRWKDYAHANRHRVMTLDGAEFLRRFLMHVVPSGFMRIRHFGLMANRFRAENLERCRELLAAVTPGFEMKVPSDGGVSGFHDQCPVCGIGEMAIGAFILACHIQQRNDTS